MMHSKEIVPNGPVHGNSDTPKQIAQESREVVVSGALHESLESP